MNQENQCLEWKESWGRGVSKIIAECEQFNLPKPTYSTSFGGLMITFFSMVEMSGKMSGKILELIKNNPEITSTQLARKTRLTVRTIERNIKELRGQNKIERIGAGNGTHWKIIE
jgi:ATP-dependent DNA helicase RecG